MFIILLTIITGKLKTRLNYKDNIGLPDDFLTIHWSFITLSVECLISWLFYCPGIYDILFDKEYKVSFKTKLSNCLIVYFLFVL